MSSPAGGGWVSVESRDPNFMLCVFFTDQHIPWVCVAVQCRPRGFSSVLIGTARPTLLPLPPLRIPKLVAIRLRSQTMFSTGTLVGGELFHPSTLEAEAQEGSSAVRRQGQWGSFWKRRSLVGSRDRGPLRQQGSSCLNEGAGSELSQWHGFVFWSFLDAAPCKPICP